MEKPPSAPSSEADDNITELDNTPIPSHPRANIPTWKWILICIILYLGAILYGLDTTVAADVQGPVYEDLGDIENLQWIGIGFPMASAATILLFSRGYGLFNVKWLIICSLTLFEVGSAICGAAPTSNTLVIGRVVAGVGGAGMYLGALTYITAFTTPAETPLYNALIGLSWGVGSILGPVVGGLFAGSGATWRWAFYINLPIAGLFFPSYIFFFPGRNPRPDLSIKTKLASIDWLGATLYAAAFVLFIVALCFSGSTYAWDSRGSIALWVVFGACFIAFIVQQAFSIFTNDRNFPVHFLKSRTLVLLFTATSSGAAAQSITLYYIPLFFQFTKGDSAIRAAIRLLPFICIFIFFVMLAGATLPIVGRYNLYYLAGGSLILIGTSLLHTINTSTLGGNIYGYEILVAAGTGLVWQNAYAIAVAKVSPKDSSKALGFINLSQLGATSISLAIAGSLFQNQGFRELKSAFAGYDFPDEYIRSALAGRLSPMFASANDKVIQIATVAVAETIRKMFAPAMAGGALLVVSSLLMRFEKLELGIEAGG
ncbi:MFS general substrate transporter [Microthyrium microscopicum]|uniref:MFS general substrate transporter n=1 Tax=Microthyrium microscopicum TaxID=703497 RepID=A0A6A6TZD8_9PEZI|nr:MFS general substrate transporter [Microthyrium microscopicum]